MIKKLFIVCAAFVWTITLVAQNISVVNSSGSTKLYRTLQAAIEGADPGSVIYLPGGGFSISDDVKITKKLTIIGIGHYLNDEGNEDGYTRIEGNLWFNENSSSGAVMGCYITGDVNIGEGDASVNDVVVRYCNLNSVQVKNSTCSGTIVNQNFVRGNSNFGMSELTITNNVIYKIYNVGSGEIKNNVICASNWSSTTYVYSLNNVNNTLIANNVFQNVGDGILTGSGCERIGNFAVGGSWGDSPIVIDASVEDIFEKYNNWKVTPESNFHFKDAYSQYEHQVGIYASTGFSDKQLAPVPYIIDKQVASETDASGKLNIKIRVKASE